MYFLLRLRQTRHVYGVLLPSIVLFSILYCFIVYSYFLYNIVARKLRQRLRFGLSSWFLDVHALKSTVTDSQMHCKRVHELQTQEMI